MQDGFSNRTLPRSFLQRLDELEQSYLSSDDPIRQSGFGGGPGRWRAEREPILTAVESDGDLLDIGCANAYLLACLMEWGSERGLTITPHGLDRGERLIQLARKRLPQYRDNFHVGSAWDWVPPQRYRYVYTLHDCVPRDYLNEYVDRLLQRVVSPNGRLIVGAYGSRSKNLPAFDVREFLESCGYPIAGWTTGGRPPVSVFAWVNRGGLSSR